MQRVREPIQDLIASAKEFYRESSLCRAICLSAGILSGILFIDAFLGFPTGTRMVYVLPVWAAVMKGGRKAGGVIVLLSTIALAVADATHHDFKNGVAANFALQTIVLSGLMLIFDRLESNLRNYTTLATKDSLTGLLNRSAFEDRAKKAIDKANLTDTPLSIAMIDCDHFKELNDHFGHAFGDEVLKLLSKTMRRCFSNESTVGRAGGDEFIVILPNRDRLQALSVLESTLDRYMQHSELLGKASGFSYGIAVLGENGFEYDRLMRAADEDMYRRKAARSGIAAVLAS